MSARFPVAAIARAARQVQTGGHLRGRLSGAVRLMPARTRLGTRLHLQESRAGEFGDASIMSEVFYELAQHLS